MQQSGPFVFFEIMCKEVEAQNEGGEEKIHHGLGSPGSGCVGGQRDGGAEKSISHGLLAPLSSSIMIHDIDYSIHTDICI